MAVVKLLREGKVRNFSFLFFFLHRYDVDQNCWSDDNNVESFLQVWNVVESHLQFSEDTEALDPDALRQTTKTPTCYAQKFVDDLEDQPHFDE